MKIESIVLKNIGAYKNQTFDFTNQNSNKNVVLIGGKNGAGKTTFLNALRTGLYGSQAFGIKAPTPSYFREIEKLINSEIRDQREWYNVKKVISKIQITFTTTTNQTTSRYLFERSWGIDAKNIKEYFNIYRDGSTLPLAEKDQSQVYSLFLERTPLYLFNVSLFDGETINQIINEGKLSEYLDDLMKSAFKLEIPDLLTETIETLVRDEAKTKLSKDKSRRLDEIKNDLLDAEQKLQHIQSEKSQALQKIEISEAEVASFSESLKAHDVISKEEETKLKDDIRRLEHERQSLKQSTSDFFSEYYAFTINHDLLKQAAEQVESELLVRSVEDLEKVFSDEFYKNVSRNLGGTVQHDMLKNEFNAALKKAVPSTEIIHDASFSSKAKVENMLSLVDAHSSADLLSSLNRDDEIIDELKILRKKLIIREENHVDFEKQFEELNRLKVNHLHLKERFEHIVQAEDELHAQYSNLVEENALLKQEIEKITSKSSLLSQNANLTLALLEDFRLQQRHKVIRNVEENALRMLKTLMRKEDYIEKLSIMPEDFSLTLLSKDQSRISVATLSSGEKQILLLSLIWAIFKVSENQMPFIFDTLLGRLDRDHRYNILRNLLPNFGEQVLVLSTDSEISKDYYDVLKPSISREYSLQFDNELLETQVIPSYFEFENAQVKTNELPS